MQISLLPDMPKHNDLWDGHGIPEFLDTSSENVTEDQVLDYLAKIIADIYLDEGAKEEIEEGM